MKVAGSQRRADYAEATRQAIIEAGRTLFTRQGYFATRVDQIAEAARVAPKTVYTVVGGKQGLLQLLVQQWVEAPVQAAGLRQNADLPSARAVLDLLSASVRSICQDHADVIQLVLAAAPHDPVAAEGLAVSTVNIRAGLRQIAREIAGRGELAEGIDVDRAVDVLYYYFGPSSFFTLTRDNGWSFEEAERWLGERSASALLAP